MQPNAAASNADILRYNAVARARCVNEGIRMVQPIFSLTFSPGSQQTVNVPPRFVGLILGFIVEITATFANATGGAATRTQMGGYNLLRQVTLTDLNNQQRINTTGWHLGLMNSARQGYVFGSAYAPNVGSNYGNNWVVQTTPSTIADSASGAVSQMFFVPCSYSFTDLRGAIYASVVNATMQLQLTIPTIAQASVAAGADLSGAIYHTAASALTYSGNVTINVSQVYIDQLPRGDNGMPVLPPLDLNNIYELKNTAVNGIAVGQDFPTPYPNYRQFLSTTVVFDNGVGTGGAGTGADVNYWSLQSANFTQIAKTSAKFQALMARQTFMADPPQGVYYFDHRTAPINTANYGNMELVLNAATVNAAAQLLIGYEDFAQVNQLVGAASLPGG